jgi:hypothetical protein
MRSTRLAAVILAVLMSAAPARAQAQATPGRDEAPPPAPQNVRFDVVINDDNSGGKAITKAVTLNAIASANQVASGIAQIRSSARQAGAPPFTATGPDGKTMMVSNDINLNVDVNRPVLMANRRIRVPMVVEYRPYSADPKAATTTVRASIDMLMESGRKTVISQSADPITDRKVIIEVTATIQP